MAEKEELASTEDIVNENSCDSSVEGKEEIFTFGFDIKSEKSDLVLTVENRPLYVKRADLENVSPVFESLFESKLKEQTTNELTIDGENYKDFVEFLACIQPRGKRKVSKNNVFMMLAIANKYRVEELKDRCEYCLRIMLLEKKPLEAKTILKFLDWACTFGLDELKKSCLEKASTLTIDLIGDNQALGTLGTTAKSALYEEFLPSLISKSHLADFMMTNIPKKEKERLQRFTNARKVQITYKSNSKTVCHKFRIWDINWEIEIEFGKETISSIKIKHDTMFKFTCQLGLAYVFVNHMHEKEDRPKWKFWDIDSSKNKEYEAAVWVGLDIDEMFDKSFGLYNKGIFTMDIHVLVNKPVFK